MSACQNTRPLGQSLLPLLDSLNASSQGGIPVLPVSSEFARNREPSPGAIALENAIEDARRDSVKLEERRSTILGKVDKLEKKKAKKKKKGETTQASYSKMAEQVAAAAADNLEDQTDSQTPRQPPIVFKGIHSNSDTIAFFWNVMKRIEIERDGK